MHITNIIVINEGLNYMHNAKVALPSILCIQIDNNACEIMNKFSFGLYVILLNLGYFKEVKVEFILVE
jgi:hypothetical protein